MERQSRQNCPQVHRLGQGIARLVTEHLILQEAIINGHGHSRRG
jgi:hypothetical protein